MNLCSVQRGGSPAWRQSALVVAGWTLIELMGVLAVLAILTAVFVPLVVREFDRVVRAIEAKEMVRIASAVEQGIRRHRQIPDASGWADLAAGELGRRTEDVLTNSRGGRRLWIVDPRLRIGPDPGAPLPYQQTAAGSVEPVSARVVLLSSVGEPPPATVRDGVASSNARFDAIWAAASGVVPTGWTWAGRGEDLTIQRFHFNSLFVPVVLNQSPELPGGRFGFDATGTNVAPPAVSQSWYLRETLLRLHGPDDALQVSLVLQTPVSVGFERGAWRGRLTFLTTSGHWNGAAVDEASDRFLAAPGNESALGSGGPVAQTNVLHSLSNYFATYIRWANLGFPRVGEPATSLQSAADLVGSVSADLIHRP